MTITTHAMADPRMFKVRLGEQILGIIFENEGAWYGIRAVAPAMTLGPFLERQAAIDALAEEAR